MANAITKHTVKCRVDENSEKHECVVSIEWDDASAERTFAARGAIIAAQSIMRATGDIPATYSVKISELAKRERGGFAMKPTAENAKRLLGKLPNDEFANALRAMGVSERDVQRMLAGRVQPAATPAKVAPAKVPAAKK